MKPVALVTGAGRGIGRGIALALARAGFDLALLDLARDAEAEATLAGVAAAGSAATFVAADIADLEAQRSAIDAAWTATGGIDCLVNNAGVSVAHRGDMLDVSPESFDRVLGINLRGTFFLTQALARRMVAAGARGHPRSIVTISSSNAEIASPERAEYCIAKAGLAMLTRLLAVRLAGEGIMAYDIRPGLIRTDMTRASQQKYDRLLAEGFTPIARWGEPDDVARAVTMLARGDLPFVTGEAIHVDGGLHIHRY
ncbi:MAG: 3-ketoacyl-ACP reductase [Betaproteobacteria bacterium]|nr:3-ketoacyl-ACP reductase [Betaproteobacteria bacterium]MBK6600736.1 3-ketoacyl-ACP reductase [Betaproteobacteria bacterium]MBK7590622.1 3-ketoacyl-ACP reductase [Betaproteobacteria bacterium]MBK7745159.1 3-ketoacyl-ACP reductase [Betaproteobacteria bacterium]MBK8689820.1 3-ketoacyl-ACP reductase [Betaproteobacteria bacterium]